MSEMVERVAKALCKAADDDWDWSVFYIVDANDTAETGRELYRKMARAAIEAMLSPTNAMYAAANDAFVPASDAAACWHAMIDAALKD